MPTPQGLEHTGDNQGPGILGLDWAALLLCTRAGPSSFRTKDESPSSLKGRQTTHILQLLTEIHKKTQLTPVIY